MINLHFFLVRNLLYTVLSCCSVIKSSLTLQIHGLQHTRLPGPSLSPHLLKLMSTESMMPSRHLILCPSSPPALNLSQHQVFCNELALDASIF